MREEVQTLVDSGSVASFVLESLVDEMGCAVVKVDTFWRMANGRKMRTGAIVQLVVSIAGVQAQVTCHVVDTLHSDVQLLLGRDFMAIAGIVLMRVPRRGAGGLVERCGGDDDGGNYDDGVDDGVDDDDDGSVDDDHAGDEVAMPRLRDDDSDQESVASDDDDEASEPDLPVHFVSAIDGSDVLTSRALEMLEESTFSPVDVVMDACTSRFADDNYWAELPVEEPAGLQSDGCEGVATLAESNGTRAVQMGDSRVDDGCARHMRKLAHMRADDDGVAVLDGPAAAHAVAEAVITHSKDLRMTADESVDKGDPDATGVDEWFEDDWFYLYDVNNQPSRKERWADVHPAVRGLLMQERFARLTSGVLQPEPAAVEPAVIEIEEGARPFKCTPGHYTQRQERFLSTECGLLSGIGVVERGFGSWGHRVVLPEKKDGDLRFCCNFRPVNKVTIPDAFPSPLSWELPRRLNGMCFFSKLDFKKGFFQVGLSPKSRAYTGFVTPEGLFQWTRLAMGLRNSSAVFQRAIMQTLAGMEAFSFPNIDDIIVYTRTFEEHLVRLEQMLERLDRDRWVLNVDKSKFLLPEVVFLGNRWSREGVSPDPDKVSCVALLPPPQNQTHLRSFLGCTNFFRHFIEHYAEIARPLSKLTSKKVVWRWADVQQRAFLTLKLALCTAPVLRYPDFDKEFIIETDASDGTVGGVLLQVFDGKHLQPVAYFSKNLTKEQRNYCTTERECLAVLEGIKRWEEFVGDGHFVVRSDHNPLQWLREAKSPNTRLLRWAVILQGYDFHIVYKPGRTMFITDFLSRLWGRMPLEGVGDDMLVMLRAELDALSPDDADAQHVAVVTRSGRVAVPPTRLSTLTEIAVQTDATVEIDNVRSASGSGSRSESNVTTQATAEAGGDRAADDTPRVDVVVQSVVGVDGLPDGSPGIETADMTPRNEADIWVSDSGGAAPKQFDVGIQTGVSQGTGVSRLPPDHVVAPDILDDVVVWEFVRHGQLPPGASAKEAARIRRRATGLSIVDGKPCKIKRVIPTLTEREGVVRRRPARGIWTLRD